jgi:hypothetical protein
VHKRVIKRREKWERMTQEKEGRQSRIKSKKRRKTVKWSKTRRHIKWNGRPIKKNKDQEMKAKQRKKKAKDKWTF